MAVGCPAKCAKVLLIIFNVIFWLSGAALLAIGIWLRVDPSILNRFHIFTGGSSEVFIIGTYFLIGVGAFIFITGFLGCCGAIKENQCMLGTYIFLLVLVMLAEITVAVLAFVFKNQIEDFLTDELKNALAVEPYGNASSGTIEYTTFALGMNTIQVEFKCCGVEDAADWEENSDVQALFAGGIPYACCPLREDFTENEKPQLGDLENPTCDKNNNSHDIGCKDGLEVWIEQNAVILIGLGIGIACLEIFGIIFAVCVCRNPSADD